MRAIVIEVCKSDALTGRRRHHAQTGGQGWSGTDVLIPVVLEGRRKLESHVARWAPTVMLNDQVQYVTITLKRNKYLGTGLS
jgi:hypothetical protein